MKHREPQKRGMRSCWTTEGTDEHGWKPDRNRIGGGTVKGRWTAPIRVRKEPGFSSQSIRAHPCPPWFNSLFPLWFLGILTVILCGCHRSAVPTPASPPVVIVQTPVRQLVTENLDLTGTVAASRSVNLVARVSGFLESVEFKDGAFVEAGQLLFVIEPEPYRQQVALNEAQYVQAQSEYDRQQDLIRQNATSKANVEKWLSSRDQAQAQLVLSKINLGYTQIRAPFSGRIGRRQVDPGNLVGVGGATPLATLEQLRPIYVNFSMNERDALHLRDEMRRLGLDLKAGVGKATVLVGLNNETGYPHQGVLDFTDNEVSTSTGTLGLRAVFPNEERILFPGLFARVRIPLGDPQPILVIPRESLGNDPLGDFVLVVEPDQRVKRRTVVTGPLTAGGSAIRSGLTESDRVVVSGLLNVRPGDTVTAEIRGATTP
jgi:RND family efflux transporter MFP subunit